MDATDPLSTAGDRSYTLSVTSRIWYLSKVNDRICFLIKAIKILFTKRAKGYFESRLKFDG